MQLSGINGDGSVNLTQAASTALLTSFAVPDAYGLVAPIAKPSLLFDATTGWLAIAGNANNNIVKQTITNKGYYQFDIDGSIFSSDRTSKNYSEAIAGATKDSVLGINFDGGLGYDTLLLSSQKHSQNFDVIADEALKIDGQISANSIFLKSQDIVNEGAIVASNITAEFSRSYRDVIGAKITASNGGSILLNGGQTGDLQAQGEFFATGATGGAIDFRGKSVNLIGANLDASGKKSGGTILIGGDYQGGDPTGLGTLSNAQTTFVDQNSRINASAVNTGNGGKVIIWADGDTDFRGSITAQGGSKSGDGGFVEVSGKQNLNFVGEVDVDATNGEQGSILFDPTDIIINADDQNPDTFDISNINKLKGNITLSATNDIVYDTDAYFVPSRGTLTIQADADLDGSGSVSLLGYLWAGLRNINISGASIIANARGYISTNSDKGNSGNIRLTSQREIDFGQTGISTAASGHDAGDIILKAGTFIKTGLLNAGGSFTNGGNVKLSANGDISTLGIRTDSYGTAGNISLVSIEGKINTTNNTPDYNVYISAVGANGNGGSVTLNAYGDIVTNDIHAESHAGGVGGSVKLISQFGKIDTNGKQVLTYANYGNAGKVNITAGTDIKVGDILTSSNAGGDVIGNGGAILIEADGGIETGNIATTSIAGNAGNVKITADGDILTGAIASNTFDGSGKGGNISLTSDRGNIEIDYARSDSTGGKSGNITLDANKRFVKVTGSIDIEGRSTSIYSGEYKKGSITIKHGGGSQLIPFIVGDSSVNGTFAEIQGKEGIASKSIFPESFSWKQISIITDSSALASAFAGMNNSFLPSFFSSSVTFPTIPTGVSIDNNIKIAIENRFVFGFGGAILWNPFWFYNKVKNNADWDYKQLNSAYQNFGNFNYGATGKAFGFPEHTLLQEAGIAQIKAGTSQPEWGNPGTRGNPLDPGTPPYGDDPVDQYWIKEGIKYYDQVYAPSQADAFKRQFEIFPTDYNFRLF